MFLTELDFRTETSGSVSREYDYNVIGRLDTPAEFDAVNRRETGLMAAYGMSQWYYSMSSAFHSPYPLAGVREAVGIHNWAVRNNANRFTPEVAVFVDEEAASHISMQFADRVLFPSTSRERSALFLSGVPLDIYAMEDLTDPRLPPYKVYVFLTSYVLRESQRAFINTELKKDSHTLVWMHAAGYIGEQGLSTSTMSEAVGMTIRKAESSDYGLDVICAPSREPNFQSLLPVQVGDFLTCHSEKFSVDDPDAVTLGTYVKGGEPALALKRCPGWTSVYIARPGGLGPDLLHAIARDAGAFTLMAPGNAAATDGNILMIHGVAGGRQSVRLPFRADVQDLITNRLVADAVEQFDLDIPVQETFLFGLRQR